MAENGSDSTVVRFGSSCSENGPTEEIRVGSIGSCGEFECI